MQSYGFTSRRPSRARAIVTSSCVLDIAARRHAGRNARHSGGETAQGTGKPVGRGFALKSGAGGQNHLVHIAAFDPRQKSSRAKLIGAYAVQGRQGSMQHVINAVVSPRAFDGFDIGGLFDNANEPLVTRRGWCRKCTGPRQ